MVSKKSDNQPLIWGVIIALVVIVIGVIIYFIIKNHQKENFIDDEEEENLVENYEDDETINNYIVNSYTSKFIEDYELLNLKNEHCNPLHDHFHKILHVANVVCREPNLNSIRHEAERIGLHKDVVERVLKDEESARKFASTVHMHLAGQHDKILPIIKSVAPEIVSEVKLESSPSIEKFKIEYFEENRSMELLKKRVKIQDRAIRRLKQCINTHIKGGHKLNMLPQHPEVKVKARMAHVNRETLEKIVSCAEEALNFVSGKTDLEHYSPEDYIENYSWKSFTRSIKHGFEKAGSAIKHTAEQAGAGIKHGFEVVKGGIEKGAEWVKHTAEDVGKSIKEAAATVGTFVVNTANKVAEGAKKAFEAVKAGIQKGIEAVVNGIKEFVELLKEFGALLKELIMKGVTALVDFVREIFPSLVAQFIRCKDGTPNKLTPCDSKVYQINSKKLKQFLAKKMLDLVFTLLGQPYFKVIMDLLMKIPPLKDKLMSGITTVFEHTAWPLLKDLIDKLINSIIHAIVPSIQFNVELSEWFKYMNILENFEQSVEDGTFEKDLKQHIRSTLNRVRNSDSSQGVELGPHQLLGHELQNGTHQLLGRELQNGTHQLLGHEDQRPHQLLGRNGHGTRQLLGHEPQNGTRQLLGHEPQNGTRQLLGHAGHGIRQFLGHEAQNGTRPFLSHEAPGSRQLLGHHDIKKERIHALLEHIVKDSYKPQLKTILDEIFNVIN